LKWGHHLVCTACVGAAVNLEMAAFVGIMAGGVFPDALDSMVSGGSQFLWRAIHRTLSHWPYLYLAPIVPLVFFWGQLPLLFAQAILWFLVGSLVHLAGDMLTPSGVPVSPVSLKNTFSLHWFRTGSFKEYLFMFPVTVLTVGLLGYRFLHGDLRLGVGPEQAAYVRDILSSFIAQ